MTDDYRKRWLIRAIRKRSETLFEVIDLIDPRHRARFDSLRDAQAYADCCDNGRKAYDRYLEGRREYPRARLTEYPQTWPVFRQRWLSIVDWCPTPESAPRIDP